MLIAVDVDHPSFLIYLNDATDYHIANVGPIALTKWSHAHHLIDLMNNSCHTSIDRFFRSGEFLTCIGTMACNEALPDVVTRKNNFL